MLNSAPATPPQRLRPLRCRTCSLSSCTCWSGLFWQEHSISTSLCHRAAPPHQLTYADIFNLFQKKKKKYMAVYLETQWDESHCVIFVYNIVKDVGVAVMFRFSYGFTFGLAFVVLWQFHQHCVLGLWFLNGQCLFDFFFFFFLLTNYLQQSTQIQILLVQICTLSRC